MRKRVQSTIIFFVTLAVCTCFAQGPKVRRELAHLPPAVQKTIRATKGNGKLNSIEKNTEDGAVTYDVEIVRNGKTRSFTVDDEGELLDEEVFLDELPAAVQNTIQKQLGAGTLGEIDKSVEDGEPSYDVEMTNAGKTRSFTVGAKGRLLDVQVFTSELPQVLQVAIQKSVGGDKLDEIKKCFDGDAISYDVEVTAGNQTRTLSFDPDGTLWFEEKDVNLSDTPEPVQKQINTLVAGGKLLGITKVVEDGEISFDADVQNGDSEKTISLGPDGKVLPDAGNE